MYQVIKRDGTVVDFDLQKIRDAILKAFVACNRNEHPSVTDFLALKTTADFESKIKNGKICVEDIQDSVESVLSKAGYSDVAKAYILYRKNHEKMRNIKGSFLDYKDLVNNYLNVNSWRVKENSTVTYSIGGLILSNSGAITANYWLSEIYDQEIADAHRNADMHIHDLSMLTGYCFTGDTRIKTLDGKNPSFEELVESGTKELLVYAFDIESGEVTIAKAINPRVTRTADKLVEIMLSNGEIIRCTPDHLFMLCDGSYIKAKDLEENTSLMSVRGREKAKIGHYVCSVEMIELDKPIELYDLTVPEYENFALDAGIFVHNCAGWSIKQLIQEGLGGVPGKISSAPASHLSTLCNQMVNFFGILQNEWAGAQAFSSFDTYLAPFVKVDNLTYKQVKQCIQSFIFGVNTPSRWGCVNAETEVLSVDGFKKYNELNEGDLIYTWKDGELQINPVRKVVIKPFKGKLHSYKGRHYNQTVTPNHRMLVRKHNKKDCEIRLSEDIFDAKSPYALPVQFSSSAIKGISLTDDEIRSVAMNGAAIPSLFFGMNQVQANVFLKTWAIYNGDESEMLLQCDTSEIVDQIQQIALLAGYTSYVVHKGKTCYVKLRKAASIYPSERTEVDYDDVVWCPNVENGTAVFRYEGNIYISGQTQAPFTNITLDWTVPDDLAELNCIVGGKEMDFKYKDCQKEMDMVNKAFIETMLEGDANGRGFQYPIDFVALHSNVY